MPRVTVLLPTYQSERYLSDAVDSVLTQSFSDFELLVVDDGSTDRTLDILRGCADPRIRVVQGRRRGLADALNLGIDDARGEYVARFDADDLMVPNRLARQVEFLDENPGVAVCGGWQQYFGLSTFLHKPAASAAQCRANLLFTCDLCHSTVTLRREFFRSCGLRYDGRFAAEDFELWTRVLDHGEIANLPEVLGYYRDTGHSITDEKRGQLIRQNGQIVAATLARKLQLQLSEGQRAYFAGWVNPFYGPKGTPLRDGRRAAWEDLRQLLAEVWMRNRVLCAYDGPALLQAIRKEWLSLRYRLPFQMPVRQVTPETLFQDLPAWQVAWVRGRNICQNYRGVRRKLIKVKSRLEP